MRKLLLPLLLVLACAHANAVTVRGAPSCGKWVKDAAANDWPALSNQSWLVGYLSGIAIAQVPDRAGSTTDILKGVDNPSIMLWMDNYCTKNPLNDVSDGANVLYFVLKDKNRK